MATPIIFGLGCTPLTVFSSAYFTWLKRKGLPAPSVIYVSPNANPPKQTAQKGAPLSGRLVMVDGVATFFRARQGLRPQDRVVISDTPVLLSEVPGLQCLDWDSPVSYRFILKPFDPAKFHSMLQRAFKSNENIHKTEWTELDQIGLIIEDTAVGSIVAPIKAAQANISFEGRQKFRSTIADWLLGNTDTSKVKASCANLMGSTPLGNKLANDLAIALSANEVLLRKAVLAYKSQKSFKTIIKDSSITEFEIKFLARHIP